MHRPEKIKVTTSNNYYNWNSCCDAWEKFLPTKEELKDLMPSLIEKHFPKGKCKERGSAIVLLTEYMLAINKKIRG